MGVFQVFKIKQMVPNHTKCLMFFGFALQSARQQKKEEEKKEEETEEETEDDRNDTSNEGFTLGFCRIHSDCFIVSHY